MTTVGSGGSMPSWFHNERANALPDSKGDKKLRFDLFDMLEIKNVDKTTMDVANQFLVAAATGDVEESSDAQKTAKLPGRVAVKVGQEGSDKAPVYKYAFLNLNSLAKRLQVSAADIKEQEKAGTLDVFIRGQIKKLADQQEGMTELLMAVAAGQGGLVFGVKKVLKEGLLDEKVPKEEGLLDEKVPKEEGLLDEKVLKEGLLDEKVQEPVKVEDEALSPNEEGNRILFSAFIEENFSDDKYLMGNLEDFLNKAADKKAATPYLKHLASKLWWQTGLEAPRKSALTSINEEALKSERLSVFTGTAASRPGNKGNETTRVQFIRNDKDNRFAVAIKEFVHTKEPEISGNYVPLRLREDMWVEVNKNSLKRLGLSSNEIRNAVEKHSLRELIEEKRQWIEGFSEDIIKLRTKLDLELVPSITQKDIELIERGNEHPDEKVRGLTKGFLKSFDPWKKETAETLSKSAYAKEAVGRVEKYIEKLEKADVVPSGGPKLAFFNRLEAAALRVEKLTQDLERKLDKSDGESKLLLKKVIGFKEEINAMAGKFDNKRRSQSLKRFEEKLKKVEIDTERRGREQLEREPKKRRKAGSQPPEKKGARVQVPVTLRSESRSRSPPRRLGEEPIKIPPESPEKKT